MSEWAREAKQPSNAAADGRRGSNRRRGDPSGGLVSLQGLAGNAAVTELLRRRGRPRSPKPPDGLLLDVPAAALATLRAPPAVQRAPQDPLEQFTDEWMKKHVALDNAAFTEIATLPDDQRTAVLARVRARYGSEYVRRGQAGILPEKPPDDKVLEPLNAEDYWTKYASAHLGAALDQVMNTVNFDITGPGLTFPTSECSALAHFALVGRLQRLAPADVSQLIETPVLPLVDGARVVDDLGKGADALEPAVTQHIAERLGLGLRRATSRLGLPYALARAKAIEDARTADQFGSTSQPGPTVSPEPAPVLQAQPPSTAFGAQTSIELGVAEAMTSGRFVAFDEATFGRVYLPQMTGTPRPVELELERGAGDWKSVRVVKPSNATAADVANALFGTPEDAQFVVGRGDRWSFAFPPSGVLAEPYDSWWREHIETDEGGGPLELTRGRAPGDPLLGVDDEEAKLRALDSVAGRHADGDQGAVLQRLEIIASHLAATATAAGPLGVADSVQPALDRIRERMAACAADPAEAQKWSAHTVDQLTLLSEVRTGFEAITQQMFASGVPAVSTPEGEQLAGDVTASMQAPTVDLTNAYARVVTASDQLDLAQGRLATAKERLAAYPFDMADRMLAMIRKRVAALDDYAAIPLESYSRARLDALQAELSAQVAALRTAVVNGDGSAAMRLGELKTQLAMLDLQSTVGSTISLIADLEGMLFASESWKPDTEREWAIYAQLKVALAPWRALGEAYDELWRAGKDRDESTMAQIRKRVEALRKDTPLPALIQQVASFQKDEAERQRIIAIGVMIAAVLISMATGGLASGAIAATGGALAGFVGGVVGAGVEALTFTAITGTLNADQTFGGFMAELGINFATFGGLRAISGTAKVLAGAGKLSLAGTAAEMTVEGLWMVAVDKAGEEIRARVANGEKMTTQSAATIFGHQMLISFAGRVIARGLGAVAGSRPGITDLAEVKAYVGKQLKAEALARQFLAKGDDSLGAALVRADTNALRAEVAARQRIHEIAIDPQQAKKFGIELSADELAKLTAGIRSAARELAEREIGALMQRVEVQADHAIAEPAVFAELVAKHRQLGSTVVEGIDAAGSPKARIAPWPRTARSAPRSPCTPGWAPRWRRSWPRRACRARRWCTTTSWRAPATEPGRSRTCERCTPRPS
jgi:hypothetical protein